MAASACLKMKLEKAGEVKGECEIEGHKGEIDIINFTFFLANPGNLGKQDGTKSIGGELSLSMAANTASPMIALACVTGDPIKEFKLTIANSVGGQKPIDVITYILEAAFVSSFNTSFSGFRPIDDFRVNYRILKIEVKQQPKGGTPEKPFKAAFDFALQKAV